MPTTNEPATQTEPRPPYRQSVEAVLQRWETDSKTGLATAAVQQRLAEFGPNELDLQETEPWWRVLFRQFISALVGVLAVAAGLAFAFGEIVEGFAIIAVIVINAVIGFVMEMQAIRSMDALRKLSRTQTRVLRDGKAQAVDAVELVPGDVIKLEAGDVVPADGRILTQANLGVKEAALTGESMQVSKQVEALEKEVTLADRRNMVFKGTVISRGHADAVVVATGQRTELGQIADLAQSAESKSTPLDHKLESLSKKLLWLTLGLAVLILAIGLLQGRELELMIETAVALAVAAIPEGLPIVATIALARGMLRLANQQVVVKRLTAVETLGETEVILTDKTGTLTENDLTVDTLMLAEGDYGLDFSEEGIQFRDEPAAEHPAYDLLIHTGVLCSNAELQHDSDGETQELGDPLEAALLKFAEYNDVDIKELREQYPRLEEIPFDSDQKFMATLNEQAEGGYFIAVKGALEVLLERSKQVLTKDGLQALDKRETWMERAEQLAADGLRLLALAYRETDKQEKDDFAQDLILLGGIAFLDPPRDDIRDAIATSRAAGIQVVMLTGDHPSTARNIALKTGLVDDVNAPVIQGGELKDFEQLNDEEHQRLINTHIFARVTPAQKLNIVKLYQNKGRTVGMTGDGVNDAPALKLADIGIAMGLRGTEAAKEVADLILKDDAFTSIVLAIRQGRGIFANIRNFVIYLLSCNLSELLVVTLASLAGTVLPLLPLQILFLNLVTDVFPALALGLNRESPEVMHQRPRRKDEPIISRRAWMTIGLYAVALTIGVMSYYLVCLFYFELPPAQVNTLAFYTLVGAQLWHVFNLPGADRPFWRNEVTRNPYAWYAIVICVAITVLAYVIAPLREVLHLAAVEWKYIAYAFVASWLPVLVVQVAKRGLGVGGR